jgi:hypothetical protein
VGVGPDVAGDKFGGVFELGERAGSGHQHEGERRIKGS